MIPYDTTMAENTSTNKAYYLNSSSISLEVGKQSTISVYPYPGTPEIGDDDEVLWISDNSTGVSVENKGSNTATIKALVANLTATISVTVNGIAVADTCNVSVFGVSIDSIAISNTSLSLNEGASGALSAKVGPENASVKGVKWSSSNENVATVDQSGKVQALSAGVATISAETTGTNSQGQHLTASCSVAVEVVTKDSVVAFADNYAKQFDENADSKYCVTLNTFLYVDKKYTIPLLQGRKVDKADGTPIPALLLTSISYHKEVYKPGFLELVIETEASMSAFSGTVTLEYDKQVVASTYHIFEKRKKNKYVTLRAYSVDKFLTIDKFSQAFTGKTLIDGIVKGTLTNYNTTSKYITSLCEYLKGGGNSFNEGIIVNLRHLLVSSGTEPELPYNVQFEESFYDFLVRICNRNGEFLYVEDNTLHIGINVPVKKSAKAISNGSATGYEIEYTEEEESCDYTTISNKKQFPEEYYKPVRTKDDDFAKNEDYYIDGALSLSLIKPIVESPHIMDAIPQTAMACGAIFGLSEMFKKQANENFKADFGDYTKGDVYQFVDGNNFGNQFYAEILKNEKLAEQKKLIVTSSTYKHHKLGDTVKVDDKFYVVYQVRGGAKIMDGVIESQDIKRYKEEFEMVLIPYIGKETESSENITSSPYPMPLPKKNTIKPSAQRAIVSANNDPMRLGRVRVLFDWQDPEDPGNASPWINIASPMASQESGFMFLPAKGDTVLVDFEDGNVENPYVVGSFYREDRLPSYHASTQNGPLVNSLTSANGHHLTFTDIPGKRFGANLWPFSYFAKFGYLDNLSIAKDDNKLGGGFELADYYGFYSITGSTHDRKVSIKSPFGDVAIDAFQGITISAPSGNIKIEGKNVEISARNNLTITSGTNIANARFYSGDDSVVGTGKNKHVERLKYFGLDHLLIPMLVAGGKMFFDLSLYRTWLETLFRPIGGTLLLKSHRFMRMEAGKGGTVINKTKDELSVKNLGKSIINLAFGVDKEKSTLFGKVNTKRSDIIGACSNFNTLCDSINQLETLIYGTFRYMIHQAKTPTKSAPPPKQPEKPAPDVKPDEILRNIKKIVNNDELTAPYKVLQERYKSIILQIEEIGNTLNRIGNTLNRIGITLDRMNNLKNELKDWISNLTLDKGEIKAGAHGKPRLDRIGQRKCQRILYDAIKAKVEETFVGKDLIKMEDSETTDTVNELKKKITLHTAQKEWAMKTQAIASKAFGISAMWDDRAWGEKDTGNILLSAEKGKMFRIGQEGQLVQYTPNVGVAWKTFIENIIDSVPDMQ